MYNRVEDELGVSYDSLYGDDPLTGEPPDPGSNELPRILRRQSTRGWTPSQACLENIASLCATWRTSEMVFNQITQSWEPEIIPTSVLLPIYNVNMSKNLGPKGEPSVTGGQPLKDYLGVGAKVTWEDPLTFKAMLKHIRKDYYLEAMLKEQLAWTAQKVLTYVKRSDVPKQCVVMGNKPVWKSKANVKDNTLIKDKYRLTIDGSVIDSNKVYTFDATVSIPFLRLMLVIAVRYDFKFITSDMSEFFLGSDLREGEEYYMEIPEGWSDLDRRIWVAKINKAVYGLPTASQTAGEQLTKCLVSLGFTKLINEPKGYIRYRNDNDVIITGYHVDDGGFIFNNRESMQSVFTELEKLGYGCQVDWEPDCYRGIQIEYLDNGAIRIHLSGHIEKMAEKYGFDTDRLPFVPCPPEVARKEREAKHTNVQASADKVKLYLRRQGDLQWVVTCYPSCTYTVNFCARFMANPQPRHFDWQTMCMRYMYSIRHTGITYRRSGPAKKYKKGDDFDDLGVIADSSFAEEKDSKSTSGNLITTDNGPLVVSSKAQSIVTVSTCESEIVSNKEGCITGKWLKNLITELGFVFTKPTVCLQDNKSAIALCESDAHHKRSRHFRVACDFLRQLYLNRDFIFEWCASTDMQADVLTKSLYRVQHKLFEIALSNSEEQLPGRK